MAGKTHPYIDALKISSLIFGAGILIIVFLVLYVAAEVRDRREVEPARVEQNLEPPGRLYGRQAEDAGS